MCPVLSLCVLSSLCVSCPLFVCAVLSLCVLSSLCVSSLCVSCPLCVCEEVTEVGVIAVVWHNCQPIIKDIGQDVKKMSGLQSVTLSLYLPKPRPLQVNHIFEMRFYKHLDSESIYFFNKMTKHLPFNLQMLFICFCIG